LRTSFPFDQSGVDLVAQVGAVQEVELAALQRAVVRFGQPALHVGEVVSVRVDLLQLDLQARVGVEVLGAARDGRVPVGQVDVARKGLNARDMGVEK
jgi:hypothetical protein